jgi:membrane-bound lytic murein transglycosylase D
MLMTFNSIADTNLTGDYIIVLDNPNKDGQSKDLLPIEALDPSFNLNKNIQQPTLNYLPEPQVVNEPSNPNQDLRQRIISGYAIPEVSSPYTQNHEAWYASRPDYMQRMMGRSQRYLYHIVTEVEKRGMPSEIALLPMVESAFNPEANSRSNAAGIWQFMPQTGKNFGLKQDWWTDNRRDITAATDAALNYLQKLHVMFGTWDLALAAYNAGEGTVQRAIERNRRKGLPTDYASLSLPNETKNYVPKLQAIKNIMTKPENYGLNIDYIPNRPYFKKVIAPNKIDAKVAAELAEISLDEFKSLNPEYKRPLLKSDEAVHEILLPVSAADTFVANLATYDKPLVNWQTYHAKQGERLDKIAKKFGVDAASLRDANSNISSNDNSQAIMIPNSKPIAPEADRTSNSELKHTVEPKETLFSIARRYGTSVEDIVSKNQLGSNDIQIGQELIIFSKPTKTEPKPKRKRQSRVR